MKLVLYGDGEKEVDKDKCVDLAENIIKEGLMPLLLDRFTNLPFEARKDAAQIFNNIARHNHGGFADPYIADQHFSIMEQLINVRRQRVGMGWREQKEEFYSHSTLTSFFTHRATGTPRWR